MTNDEHCGHDHAHDHCGHAHDHCGHDHTHEDGEQPRAPRVDHGPVTENQAAFLHQLGHSHYLPVARFLMENSTNDDICICSLAPVFLRSAADSMETVKEAGAFLTVLEEMGLITLDYDIKLDGYAYAEYEGSALYEYFCQTVREAAGRPGFLGDTPYLELGSIALTEAGELIAAAHCGGEHHHTK